MLGEGAEAGVELRLAAEHDERTCLVVDAVAVLGARHVVPGVLEEAAAVAHREEVGEHRHGRHAGGGHAAGRADLSWLTTSR